MLESLFKILAFGEKLLKDGEKERGQEEEEKRERVVFSM